MEIVLAGIGALFGLLLIHAMVRSFRERLWDGPAILAFAAVVLPNLTLAVATITNGRVVSTDNFYNRLVTIAGPAVLVNEIATPVLALVALVVLLSGARAAVVNGAALALACLLVLAGFSAGLTDGGSLVTLTRLAALSVVIVCIFIRRSSAALMGAAFGIGAFAVSSLLAAPINPEHVLGACDQRKCGTFGVLFTGIADNNNAFGILAAIGIPIVWFGLHRYRRLFAVLLLLLALASGSRTAQIAAVVTLVALMIFDSQRLGRFGRGVVISSAAASAGAMILAPSLNLSNEALTGRPELWQIASGYIDASPVIGNGPELWRSLVYTGVIPRAAGYSTHNQALEVLFVAGWAGVVLAIIFVIALVRQNREKGAALAAIMLPLFICGITERPWTLGGVDWMFWSLIVVCMAVLPAPPSPRLSTSIRPEQGFTSSLATIPAR